MKVSIDSKDETILDGTLTEINSWWQNALKGILEHDHFIYNVTIDGNIMFANYEQYIVENIQYIKDININTISKSDSIDDTMISIHDYLGRFIPISYKVSGFFYGNMEEEHWNLFSDLLKGLEWIVKSVEFLVELSNKDEDFNKETKSYLDILGKSVNELFISLEQKDYISVGDIIQYEVVTTLQKFNDKISELKG